MKKVIFIIAILICQINYGQIGAAVVSAPGVESQIAVTNTSINTLNGKIATLNTKVTQTNQKLDKIISLLEDLIEIEDRNKEINEEELQAKKTTPDYLINSSSITSALDLKEEIINAFNTCKNKVEALDNLSSSETSDFISSITKELSNAVKFYNETNTYLNTQSIINPEERGNKIEDLNKKLKDVLKNILSLTDNKVKISQKRENLSTMTELTKTGQ